ncbi:hypothetical protein [Kaarinaea lacus]
MNVAFVVPRNDDQHQPQNHLMQCRIFPPAGLARMAGIIGKHASVSLIDERIEEIAHTQATTIAIIFANSYNQQRAIDLARRYRALGSFVVMTGTILGSCSDLFSRIADCLLIGGGEDHIANFLADYQTGKPRHFYQGPVQTTSARPNCVAVEGMSLSLAS